ncbi:hypothetical protein [Roseococcus sp. YIM B11640]|uniref:hypothetical protein n=1 Tax=Roseococcus sp. YIM B11640 TaxID=3133973 RepID=UPI003C7C4DB0
MSSTGGAKTLRCRHVDESRERFLKRSATLGQYKFEMTQLHRQARAKLEHRQQSEWLAETKARQDRLPKGIRGLWHRITGRYQEVRAANEAEAQRTRERHGQERQTLIDKQRDQRAVLQAKFKELRSQQAQLLQGLRKDIGRYLQFTRPQAIASTHERGADLHLKLER